MDALAQRRTGQASSNRCALCPWLNLAATTAMRQGVRLLKLRLSSHCGKIRIGYSGQRLRLARSPAPLDSEIFGHDSLDSCLLHRHPSGGERAARIDSATRVFNNIGL